jgi:hypothetical protein
MTHSIPIKPAFQGSACLPVGREAFPAGLLNATVKLIMENSGVRSQKTELKKSMPQAFY